MREYTLIELTNGNQYIIVDMLNLNTKKYFLLAKTDKLNIDNYFDIYFYNEEVSSFNEIIDEYEYNSVKEIFNNRLNKLSIKLDKINVKEQKIIKLKLVDINGFDYILEKDDGNRIVLNMEIYDNYRLEIYDYIYMNEEITKEKITIRFGSLYTDKTEIIKVVRDNNIYYLQRYYG